MLSTQAFTEGLRWDTLPLAVLNGFVAALTSTSMYKLSFARMVMQKPQSSHAVDEH